ncbi:MAG: DUF349 domain-containing protein [Bacteroidales bacterium]|jgi:hypothetical protein|nr:DUF349 domain-containing protein [Bacteroidales bacterium]MDD4045190.1 DUF349 domain-containing protein [Bacteroidales bacterium]
MEDQLNANAAQDMQQNPVQSTENLHDNSVENQAQNPEENAQTTGENETLTQTETTHPEEKPQTVEEEIQTETPSTEIQNQEEESSPNPLESTEATPDAAQEVKETADNESEITPKVSTPPQEPHLDGVEEEDNEEEIEFDDASFDLLSKEEVVKTLEETVKNPDINKIKQQVALLKIRYLKLVKEEKEKALEDNLSEEEEQKEEIQVLIEERKHWEERFNRAFQQYKENKQTYLDALEQEKQQNLLKKQALLEELKSLINSNEILKKIYDQFKEIQDQWKAIGPVPQSDITELWQNYHFYVEKFFDKVKISKELKELDLKKNLEAKLALCEKAEALLLETSVFKAFNTLQQYHNEWKEIGAVPEDKKEEIWLRFKNASDLINQKRRDYYDTMSKEQENNYQAKLALCNRVQEVTNIDFSSFKQINEASNQVADILKTWKSIGPAPKQHNEDIWTRFRSILDSFYESKKQYVSKIKSEQLDNYNKKVNLCIQAEAIAQRNDWRKATDDILKLQKEWKEIGMVARKQSDILWKRFRKACDDFFETKQAYFANIEQHEQSNLAKKEALIQRVIEAPFAESKEENLEIIKAFQREWTEIGYTPIAEKERLWKEFRSAIDNRFEKLKINQKDVKNIHYQEHIKNILDDKNASEGIRREKRVLQNKISKLKEDVALWENNLGFFASSKNADLLKAEFEKKIIKAKDEIQEIESKLKLLKDIK